ncbi:MAG: DUF523 and DUF1722 domain-containing protein [Nitrospinae bacterium]|nr:DUF523 and DUF1722 domain-containing protein [Nitrospinota bacterium]
MSRAFAKPIVVVSKCLEFEACRYNGERIASSFIERLEPHVRFRPVCPEVEIGLGTPRDPIRIYSQGEQKALFQPSTRKHLTRRMNAFSRRYLEGLEEVDGFILKAKSPSCAITDARIFPTPGSEEQIAQGAGLFAGAALEAFGSRAFVDETGLSEPAARENFLTRIFALAAFREVKESGRADRLARYHAENKLLFMAYDQETMREMGRVAANHEKQTFGEAASAYESALLRLLTRSPTRATWVNALTHAVGHLSEKVSARDKARFLDAMEEYREGKIPLGEPLEILREWISRLGSEYLGKQTIFEPYPSVLGGQSRPALICGVRSE